MSNLTSCALSSDCPAGQICYVNVSWAPEPSFCACSTWYGWTGEDCQEFTFTTWYLIVSISFRILIAGLGGTIGWFDILRLAFALGRSLKFNASVRTALALTVAFNCYVVWTTLYLLTTLSPEKHDYDSELSTSGGERYTSYAILQRPFVFLVQVLAVIAALNVSVMWIELAYRAKNMRTRMIQSVTYYSRAVLVFETVFGIAMLVTAVIGRWDFAIAVALPFLLVIGVAFTLGRLRMVAVLKDALSLADTSDNNTPTDSTTQNTGMSFRRRGPKREKTSAERTRRALVHIKRVSLHVIIGIFGIITTGVAYALFNTVLSDAGWREFAPLGSFSIPTLMNDLVAWSILYTLVAVFFYSHRSTKKLLRHRRGLESSRADTREEFGSKENSSFVQSTMFGAPASPYTAGNLTVSVATTPNL